MIFHITTKNDWEKARIHEEYATPSLMTDGFIHCSTIKQTADTANRFFKGQNGLILLCIDEKKLKSACKYEAPVGIAGQLNDPGMDDLYPHIYGPINNTAVIKVINFLPDETGFFKLPEELTS